MLLYRPRTFRHVILPSSRSCVPRCVKSCACESVCVSGRSTLYSPRRTDHVSNSNLVLPLHSLYRTPRMARGKRYCISARAWGAATRCATRVYSRGRPRTPPRGPPPSVSVCLSAPVAAQQYNTTVQLHYSSVRPPHLDGVGTCVYSVYYYLKRY